MKKLAVILAGIMLIASCSQMTSNKSEKTDLEAIANNYGDIYVACVVKYSLDRASANAIDVATVVKLGSSACQTDLDQFRKSQEENLKARMMLTKKPLEASVDVLNERATKEIGEALLSLAGTQSAVAIPAAVGSAAVMTSSSSTPGISEELSAGQQDYLDCMEDQARKYAGLGESATVIADVAQSRCKAHLEGPETAALEQEGRAIVMGLILDAKLQGLER
jgi:hypothetical protein